QLYDTGQHLLDALLWTTGTDPKKVSAQIDYDKPRVDVNSSLAMLLERGDESVIASVGISGDGVEITPAEGYFFWRTNGRISYFDNQITVAEKDAVTYQTEITEGMDFQTLNRKKIENFINSIRGTEEAAVPGEVGLQVTALTEAAYRAADTESTVTVQSLIDEAIAERA
ncbi:MAG: Gfo/Idh/MocA family oxidoreductase, partial [archaeon]